MKASQTPGAGGKPFMARNVSATSATSELRTHYVQAQLAGNRREALRIVVADGLLSGVAPEELYLEIVGAAQRELGRLWEENQITVADEHLATAISQFILAQLYPHLGRAPRNGKSVAVACVAGELHDMPGRIASDFLDAAGFDVRFIGANTPTVGLIAELTAHRPAVLALSVTTIFHFAALPHVITQLRQAAADLPIVVGGFLVGAAPQLPPKLNARLSLGTTRDLVALVRELSGVRP